LVKGNDADLLTIGINKADRTQPNLVVDADVLFDAERPPTVGPLNISLANHVS
jgi:hypothetical protein